MELVTVYSNCLKEFAFCANHKYVYQHVTNSTLSLTDCYGIVTNDFGSYSKTYVYKVSIHQD